MATSSSLEVANLRYDEALKALIEDSSQRIKVEIGDSKESSKFYPRVKLKAWENECNFSIGLATDNVELPTIEEKNGLVKWKTSKVEAHFYNQEADAINEEGAYEFEIVLKEKPKSNVINFTTNIPKNLDFYYQPALTKEEIEEGCVRPDNVVGSYAVYHSTKSGDYSQMRGKNYGTGKAFHIFRPEAIDSKDQKTWCDLYIDVESQTATITVPQKYLDEAVYPVYVDPTFGYTSVGASTYGLAANKAMGCKFTFPNEAGNITQISQYNWAPYTGTSINFAIYDSNLNKLATSGNILLPYRKAQWETTDISYSAEASTDYYLCVCGNNSNSFYWDSPGPGQYADHFCHVITFGSWPDSIGTPDEIDRWNGQVSIYATYTTSGGASQTLELSGISSSAQIGTPTMIPGVGILALSGIKSSVSVGTVPLIPGVSVVTLSGISSNTKMGDATLIPGTIKLTLTGIESTTTIGEIAVVLGKATLNIKGLINTIEMGTPLLLPGETILNLASIDSTTQIGTLTLHTKSLPQTLILEGISSTAQIGTVFFNVSIVLKVNSIASTVSIGEISLIPGEVILMLDGVASTVVIGNISFVGGTIINKFLQINIDAVERMVTITHSERPLFIDIRERLIILGVEGMPLIGSVNRIKATFHNWDNTLVDPEAVEVTIYDEKGTVLLEKTILTITNRESTGVWFYDYTLPDEPLILVEFKGIIDETLSVQRKIICPVWRELA